MLIMLPVSELSTNNEREQSEKKLLAKLQEAEEAVRKGDEWLSLDALN